MRSSSYYQRWLQVVGRGSDIMLFLTGFFLGKGQIATAVFLLSLKLASGYLTSELVYRRLKAVVKEKGAKS